MKALEREPDEQQLIEAAQNEPVQFAALYDRSFDRIYAFFARRVSTREEAQDLTAEVFHQALASTGKFKWQGTPFIAWLYGIAANVLSKHWQKLGRSTTVDELDLSRASDEIERSVMIAELVRSLAPDQRMVITGRLCNRKAFAKSRKSSDAVKGPLSNCSFARWKTCGRS